MSPRSSTTLACLGESQCARVETVEGETNTRRRLLEMGLCPGVTVQLVRRAPLGDPCEFRVRGYLLSLRREQARLVTVSTEKVAA
jgi:ferrous iron transport protein A